MALVRAHGVVLKKRGNSFVGRCPFHEDSKPSFTVNPKTNLYHCFGCPTKDNGGNAITFLMKKKGLGFREAFAELVSAGSPKRAPPPVGAPPSLENDPRA